MLFHVSYHLFGAGVSHLPQFAASTQLGKHLSGVHIAFSICPKELILTSFCLALYQFSAHGWEQIG